MPFNTSKIAISESSLKIKTSKIDALPVSKYKQKLDATSQAFSRCMLTTTFHCLPKVFLSQNALLQITWLAVFTVFSVLTGALVTTSLFDYFEYQVVSKIQIIYERPAQFPTVTVCDVNFFSTYAAQQLIQNITWREFGRDIDLMSYDELTAHMENITELARMHIIRAEIPE